MNRYVLSLTTVGDQYTYFSCPGTTFVSVQVFNNGIDIGFGAGYPAAVYGPADEYLALTNASWPRSCDEIRFKNHVAGKAAQIQITAQGPADLPGSGGSPLGASNTPNFLTVNSDGTIGATFSGKIQATELDLTANPGGSPIKWLNASGGLVAEIVSDASGNITLGPGTISGSSFNAGTITGSTITASTIETSTSNPRAVMGSDPTGTFAQPGVYIVDSFGDLNAAMDPSTNVGVYASAIDLYVGGIQGGQLAGQMVGTIFNGSPGIDVDSENGTKRFRVIDDAGQSSAVKVSSPDLSTLWPQQSAAFSVPAVSGGFLVFNSNGWNTGGGWMPIAYLNGGFVMWAVTASTSNTITVGLDNPTGSTQAGTLYLRMLTF